MLELGRRDVALALAIKDLPGTLEVGLVVIVLNITSDHREELRVSEMIRKSDA